MPGRPWRVGDRVQYKVPAGCTGSGSIIKITDIASWNKQYCYGEIEGSEWLSRGGDKRQTTSVWNDGSYVNLTEAEEKEEMKRELRKVFPSIAVDVENERIRQIDKWGDDDHKLLMFLGILAEEFGEIANAILEKDYDNYRKECVQVAAVCFRMIQSFDRRRAGGEYGQDA